MVSAPGGSEDQGEHGAPPGGTELSEGERRLAFERYVVPEIPVLLHVARTLTASHHDAEDLVQDTVLRAYRSVHRFDGAHPRAWLFTIMRNTEMNRNRRRRPGLLDDPEQADRRAVEPTGGDGDPERAAEAVAFRRAVLAALARLPRPMAQVVGLVDLDGLTYAEAAQALGVPVGTVMSRLHRARSKLRSQLNAQRPVAGREER